MDLRATRGLSAATVAIAFAGISGPVAEPAPAATTVPIGTPAFPSAAHIASHVTSGPVLSLTIACKGGPPTAMCSGPIDLTSNVRTRGDKVLAVKATEHTKVERNDKPAAVEVEAVGSGSYSVPTGSRVTVQVTLNSTGLALLSRFYVLRATLTLGGTTSRTRNVTFRYVRIRSPISFTWVFSRSSTVAQQLAVSSVPPEGTVEVICRGGGCPFAMRRFTPSGGRVVLSPAFKGKRLRPKATVELEITAPNRIGKVASFRIGSGALPSLVELCLPPGAKSPMRCL